jgi:acyl-CoA synthetase (AMP-forming)/AMP-acid ligase II
VALNIADLAEHAIDAVPDRVALISDDEQLTYAQLEEKANRLAHYLVDQGVKKDDKVGLYCRNRIEIVIAMLGIVKAGAILVNVNFRYVEGELKYLFENSDMVALVHERRYADRVANVLPETPNVKTILVVEDGSDDDFLRYGGVEFYAALEKGSPERDFGERSADDIYLLYTGGTTGFPKGVMWRHEDIYRVLFGGTDFATGEFIKDEYDLAKAAAANPPMIRYPVPPMIHGATQSATWMSIFSGQTTVLAPEFDADQVWRAIHHHKVNMLFFTGDAMARPLLDALEASHEGAEGKEAYDLSSLFLLASTAALFSASIKEKFLELLPNRIITDSIGSSETGFGGTSIVAKGQPHAGGPRVSIDARTVVLDDDGNEVKPGSGVRGVIAKKGNIPVGYYKDDEKTRQTFRTYNGVRYAIPGDYAEVEADGAVTMLGRGSVSINSGGEKIYPEEVEAALKGHPDVFDALVVGVPDPRFGQHVAAVVHAREGTRPALAELDAFVRKEIAGYKVPRSLWFVDEVKRSPAGKPDYRWAKDQTERSDGRYRCALNCVTGSASSIRSSSSPLRRRWLRRSARPADSAFWGACGSTTPTTSKTCCAGWTRTPEVSRTASTSSCLPRCPPRARRWTSTS